MRQATQQQNVAKLRDTESARNP